MHVTVDRIHARLREHLLLGLAAPVHARIESTVHLRERVVIEGILVRELDLAALGHDANARRELPGLQRHDSVRERQLLRARRSYRRLEEYDDVSEVLCRLTGPLEYRYLPA